MTTKQLPITIAIAATVELNLAHKVHTVSQRRIVESYLGAWLAAKAEEDKLADLLDIPCIPGCPL